jgi:hypothetical protein
MIDNIGKYLSEVIEAVYGDRLKNFISRNPADQWFIASDYVIGDKNRPHERLIPLSQVHQHMGVAGQIRNGAGFPVFGCLEPLVGMPVAVLRPFGPRGTVETLIARSYQCPLAPAGAGHRTAFSYNISGYLGQRDEPSARRVVLHNLSGFPERPNTSMERNSEPYSKRSKKYVSD